MNSKTLTLLEEDNSVSLRTAFVNDDGDTVGIRLMPSLRDQIARRVHPESSNEFAWLYRHKRSPLEEKKLMEGLPCMAQDLKPITFERPPELKLIWSESGNSVAISVDGEPWAFIDEEAHRGYSKGILMPSSGEPIGNLWDQSLFEKRFKA